MAISNSNDAVLSGPARAHKYGVIGDRRRLAGTIQKPPPKHTFMIAGVPFEIDTKYAPLKPLGKGSYGVVCSCLNMKTGELVAIKKIGDALNHPVTALRTLREMQILRHIRHPNVIALKDASLSGHHDVYLVYEQMDADLHRLISGPQPLSNGHCKYLLFQILCGLKHLHLSSVIHRDLKPENILINATTLELKICDFGLSRTKCRRSQYMTEYVATRWYRAPELLVGSCSYGSEMDMWSVGCIFAEMLGRRPIFRESNALDQLLKIIGVLGRQDDVSFIENERAQRLVASIKSSGPQLSSICPEADPLAIDLLKKMLVFDPRKRISAAEALCHPYMGSFRGLEPSSKPMPVCLDIDSDEVVDYEDKERSRILIHAEVLNYSP